MVWHGSTFPFFLLFLLIFPGCVSNHYERIEKFNFAWKIGDFEDAAIQVEELASKGPLRDRMLYRLEEGVTKRMKGDIEGSIQAFENADNEYERWFGIHLKPQTSVSEELISTIGSPEWKPYKSRVYERVMLRIYQALNFFEIGKKKRARAEIFKIRQALQDAKEIWKSELDASREAMRRKSIDLDKGITQINDVILTHEMEIIRAQVPSNLPEYMNPAAIYFESLYFLHGALQRDDFEKAEFSLKQLLSIYPRNKWIIEDYNQAKNRVFTKQPVTYVFLETGRAPVRREKRYDFPLIFFSSTSRIPYIGLAFPQLVTNDNYLSSLEVQDENGGMLTSTLPLADFDAIISQEFIKDFPIELAKAISGSLSKGALQYLATKTVREEKDMTRAATGVAVGSLGHAFTGADWRSWTTLPKQIQFCKMTTPKSQELTLRGVNTNLRLKVPLKKAKTNIVWIRSVSKNTPLRTINVFSLDP
tara:strand:- start:739 stop:2166 length:1428 start_codon:yes stop_codon:yes gene_type:complete